MKKIKFLKGAVLILFFTGTVMFSCKKQKPIMAGDAHKLITGEWYEGSLTFEGHQKLLFKENNFYQQYVRNSSSDPWDLVRDSLHYSIVNETIFLEHELLPPVSHKITLLDDDEFNYEVTQPEGNTTLRLWRR